MNNDYEYNFKTFVTLRKQKILRFSMPVSWFCNWFMFNWVPGFSTAKTSSVKAILQFSKGTRSLLKHLAKQNIHPLQSHLRQFCGHLSQLKSTNLTLFCKLSYWNIKKKLLPDWWNKNNNQKPGKIIKLIRPKILTISPHRTYIPALHNLFVTHGSPWLKG